MLTRCPGCGTTFRVTPTQLKARAGQVRCGRCNFVFNAIDTLADDVANVAVGIAPSPAIPGVAAEAVQETPSVEMLPPNAEQGFDEVLDIGAADTTEEAVPTVEADDTGIDTESDTSTQALFPPVEVTEVTPEPIEEASPPLTDYLADSMSDHVEQPTRRWPWMAGSAVAIAGLLLQLVYFYRIELAVLRPGLRPTLQTLCKPFNCDVPRPRHIETLGIDASDLRPDTEQAGHLTLTATLRSKALYAQEWPLLELTLTDVADQKLAVKDFSVSDYLPKDKDDKANAKRIAAGFPANGEIAVTLPLDVGSLPAAGYRLYIFYP